MKTQIYILLLAMCPVLFFGQKSDTIQNKMKLEENEEYEFIYTNAVNFDFGNTTKNDLSYFGHINYFFNLKKDGDASKHYINTGMIKANYYAAEINDGSFNQIDNVLESPLSSTEPGNTYFIEYNQYDYKVKLSTYSVYIQYLWKFLKNYNSLYLHAHGEMLISNMRTSVTIKNLDAVQATIPQGNLIPLSYLNRDVSYTKQNIGAYFGAGATAKFNFGGKAKLKYFFQGTSGLSNTQLNPKLYSQSQNELPTFNEKNGVTPFFLIHSYFENNIGGLNLILGGQIRGNFTTAPLYMFYLGVNTNLSQLKGLFE